MSNEVSEETGAQALVATIASIGVWLIVHRLLGFEAACGAAILAWLLVLYLVTPSGK